MPFSTAIKLKFGNLSFTRHKHQIICSLIPSIGLFGLGAVVGWSSTALPSLSQSQDFFYLSTARQSWIASIVNFGAMLSTLLAGLCMDNFGRKSTLVIANSVQIMGWLFIISAKHISMLYIGRFINGLAIGAVSMAVPVYIGEISESDVRGSLSGFGPIAIGGGILFSYVVGGLVSWEYLSMLSAIPPVILLGLSIFLPESPRYYICNNKIDDAVRVTRRLRDAKTDDEIHGEIHTILESMEDAKEIKDSSSNGSVLSRHILMPLMCSCVLMIFQQLCGISAIIFFTVRIFESAGSSLSPNLATILVGILHLSFNITEAVLIDRAGRKVLLLISSIGMTIAHFLLAIYFGFQTQDGESSTIGGTLAIIFVLLFFASYGIGFGPIPTLLMSEILPNHVIGLASGATMFCHFLFAFWVVLGFEGFSDVFGISMVFVVFGFMTLFGVFFVFYAVPETKLKTLEEIHMFYGIKNPIVKSKQDSGSEYKTFENLHEQGKPDIY